MSLPIQFQEPASHLILLEFAEEIVALLYADQETGALTGENTIAEKSCADLVEELAHIVDRYGLTPPAITTEETDTS